MIEQDPLDLGRIHVLPAADDHVLLAVDEPEIALLVESGQIAAVKPIAGERTPRRARLLALRGFAAQVVCAADPQAGVEGRGIEADGVWDRKPSVTRSGAR